MKQVKNKTTGRIGLCLALCLLWIPSVQADATIKENSSEVVEKGNIGSQAPTTVELPQIPQELFEKKLEAENSLVIANEYSGSMRPLSTLGDAKLVEQSAGAVALTNLSAHSFRHAVQLFSFSDCLQRREAKLLWFSGHTYENWASRNYGPFSYGMIGNMADEKLDSQSLISLAGLANSMSSSNCHFVLVIDGLPPQSEIMLPTNVTVIWSDMLGGTAFHIKGSGLLTRAVVEAMKKKKVWKTEDLTTFLRRTTNGLAKDFSGSEGFLNGRPVPLPWVQSFSPDTTIKFPDAKTSRPRAIRAQEFPKIKRIDSSITR